MDELNLFTEKYNNSPLNDFSGLSPKQMHHLIYNIENDEFLTFHKSSDLNNEIPILRLISSLIDKIDQEKGQRLTPAGYLPVKIVKEIYSEHIIKDKAIESGISKLSKEFDSESIHLTKIISNLSGITRKANNKIYITKKGKKYPKSDDNFKFIFNSWGMKFNLGYLDGYENEQIGQFGFRHSLYLLSKFGDIERSTKFYSEKYFEAFPNIGNYNDRNHNCYTVRTFRRFFRYFGLIEMNGNWNNETVKKSELFDKCIKFNVSESNITNK